MSNNFHGHPDQKFGHITYAQHGDDLMIINLFELMKVKTPSYLDIGAHHPINISNTALLYKRGSRGVNVEANSQLIEDFKTMRPEDKNVNLGVGTARGVKTFYVYSPKSGRNTFSIEETRTLKGSMTVKTTIELTVVTINDIVVHYCGGMWPDLLSMDIEGLDMEVLQSAQFGGSAPKLIVVETRKPDTAKMRLLMKSKGYFCYCRMGENLFFVQENLNSLVY